ncbi:MAG: hypothetical protein JXA21_17750 [Anaerolineae bacterium]|nr:hypothetical protein [Anaerolineae bacterium]
MNTVPRTVPMNTEAEQAVLGSLLIDPESLIQVQTLLRPDDFYLQKHGWIYEAFIRLHARHMPLDFLTLTTASLASRWFLRPKTLPRPYWGACETKSARRSASGCAAPRRRATWAVPTRHTFRRGVPAWPLPIVGDLCRRSTSTRHCWSRPDRPRRHFP